MTRSVAVLGGGIAGLAAAWELSRTAGAGTQVLLFEAQPAVGGKLRGTEMRGRQVDLGPDSFVARRAEALALCEEVGLGGELREPGTSGASVWARGRLRPLPGDLVLGVPTRIAPLARSGICSARGVLRAALDPVGRGRCAPSSRTFPGDREDGDESVGSIVLRSLGREVHDRLADPLVGGIHAGPIDTMSAAAVFPHLLEASARRGSLMRALREVPGPASPSDRPVFMSLEGGVERLARRLGEALVERGVKLCVGDPVGSIEPRPAAPAEGGAHRGWWISSRLGRFEADGVVLALPGPEAASVLERTDPPLAGLLREIPYSSVTLVTFRFARGPAAPRGEGTGFLVPASEGKLLTACTWLSSKWPEPGEQQEVLVRVSMGRFGDDRHLDLPESAVVSRALEELGEMLGRRVEPLDALVTRWPGSFPQYLVGHLRRVSDIERRSRALPPIEIAGSALHGVGIPSCIASGRRAARLLLERLDAAEVAP